MQESTHAMQPKKEGWVLEIFRIEGRGRVNRFLPLREGVRNLLKRGDQLTQRRGTIGTMGRVDAQVVGVDKMNVPVVESEKEVEGPQGYLIFRIFLENLTTIDSLYHNPVQRSSWVQVGQGDNPRNNRPLSI